MRLKLVQRMFVFAAFALVGLACGLTGQALDQNNQPPNVNQDGQDSSDEDIPAVEDTVPGPAVLNLEDPSLYQYRDKNFTIAVQMSYEGTDAGFVTIDGAWVANSPPDWSLTFDTSLALWQSVVPFTYLSTGGLQYGNNPINGCYPETDDLENPYDDILDKSGFIGEAPLVESGVVINGTVTDRYQITHENAQEEDSIYLNFTYTDSSGSVYVDRITKVIVRYDQSGTALDKNSASGGSQEVQFDYQEDIFLTNSPGQITAPENCDGTASGDGFDYEGDPADIPFPIMDDAYNTSGALGLYSYETEYSTDQVAEFYMQELQALGWTLSSDPDSGSPSFYVDFQKDGEELQILVSQGEQPGTSYILITHFN